MLALLTGVTDDREIIYVVMNYLYNKECAILESQQCSKALLGKIPSEVLFCNCQLDELFLSECHETETSFMMYSLLIQTERCEVICWFPKLYLQDAV